MPPHSTPWCLEAVGVNHTGVLSTPGSFRALKARDSASLWTKGAPRMPKGSAVPRPSEQLVPSKRQVPG